MSKNFKNLKARRKKNWIETDRGLFLSEKAVENLMQVFEPSPEEVKMREDIVQRHVKEGLWNKGDDGHYYLTEKAISCLR